LLIAGLGFLGYNLPATGFEKLPKLNKYVKKFRDLNFVDSVSTFNSRRMSRGGAARNLVFFFNLVSISAQFEASSSS
jgi:hypothetical protein